MRLRNVLVVLGVGSLLVTAVGCGDDPTPTDEPGAAGTTAPPEYAERICGAASAWMTALQDRNTQLQGDLGSLPEGDFVALKELLVAFLGGAVDDTQALIGRVTALSPPEVQDGEQIHDRVLGAFTQARDLFAGARDDVVALDPTDPAFAQALTDLGTTLSDAGSEIGRSVQQIESPEMETAFDETPACDAVSAT